ncbi:MAG: porin family protein [Bacteroidota bacterium]
MKKLKILAAVIFMSITSMGMAQDGEIDNRGNLQFGLKAGLNYSNVYNSDTEEFSADAKFGFAGGLVLGIPINNYLGVQPEILFSQKGFKGEGQLLGSDYEFTRTTSYIDVPLQISLKPSEFITIVAGPQYSYLLSQNDDFTNSNVSFSQEQEFENDNIRKNILGFVAGVDINIDHIILGARAGWDIQSNHGDGTSSSPKYKNRWLQGTIGYNF